jgi:dTDP-4-amino-4,6-dideoxygalactose transaminase
VAQVFSFHATKIFPVGEGGAIVTNDDRLQEELRLWRCFGDPGTENTQLPGLNAKMQEFNALIGLENLTVIEQHIEHRREIAQLVRKELVAIPGLVFQAQRSHAYSNYQNLSLLVDERRFELNRDQLFAALQTENIRARKYFFPPVHQHDAYVQRTAAQGHPLPTTEWVSSRILCLPIYSDMTDQEAHRLCTAIKRIYAHRGAIAHHFDAAGGAAYGLERN